MAIYPDYSTIPWSTPVKVHIRFKTLMGTYDESGEENRKQKWLYPKRAITLIYNNISLSNMQTLWQFYIARAGNFEAFNFFLPDPNNGTESYVKEYVGTGDGSTVTYNLPSKNAAVGRILYVDNVAYGEGIFYTFTAGGGADGADKAVFATAPTLGSRISFSFTGRLKVHCRFAEDYFSMSRMHSSIISTGITLKGLLNE